jgi:hypothetical protein
MGFRSRIATAPAGVAGATAGVGCSAQQQGQHVLDERPLARPSRAVDQERRPEAFPSGSLLQDAPGDGLAKALEARFGLDHGHRLSIGKRPVSGG